MIAPDHLAADPIFMHTRKHTHSNNLKPLAVFAIVAISVVALFSSKPSAALAGGPQGDSPAQESTQIPTPELPTLYGGCPITTSQCGTSTTGTTGSTAFGPATLPTAAFPNTQVSNAKAILYLFWGDGCPHCAEEKPFLTRLAERYPLMEIRAYEVWKDANNRALFKKMAKAYGFEANAVPITLLSEQYWIGYSEQIGQAIEKAVAACMDAQCKDIGAGVIVPAVAEEPAAKPVAQTATSIELPLLGTVDLQSQSLVLSTALISFVDGFNPCSVWVLTMLLAITLHTGSRKKVLIIGLVFLTVTASVYALFIAGLFTMFTVVSFTGWIQLVVALVALFFGGVNIKDYFWYKEGISLTIADDQKPGLFKRMRGLVDASQSFWGLVAATVVLSGGVSLVEFSCTAGFPMIWTNLLASQKVEPLVFIGLLLLYLVIYQLDELGIFLVSVLTLKASRLEEKHGRLLKLAGGVLMLTLAIVMLINPSLMNNLLSSVIIFALAAGVTGLVLLVHRRILPAFGIWIGTERQTHTTRQDAKDAKS
jgi:thiol-disulfide isomerase/thioredoxin